MTNEEVIAQLRELIEDRESFITGDPKDSEFWEPYIKDKQALEAAVTALETMHAKHGYWKYICEWCGNKYYECSKCGRQFTFGTKYCPNCGTKMDGNTQK